MLIAFPCKINFAGPRVCDTIKNRHIQRQHRRHMATVTQTTPALPLTKNEHLLRWVEKIAELTQPARIHWVDGSQEEYDQLCEEMIAAGTLIRLNQKLWPGCFLARSHKSDVARVEDRTFICSLSKDSAG